MDVGDLPDLSVLI